MPDTAYDTVLCIHSKHDLQSIYLFSILANKLRRPLASTCATHNACINAWYMCLPRKVCEANGNQDLRSKSWLSPKSKNAIKASYEQI